MKALNMSTTLSFFTLCIVINQVESGYYSFDHSTTQSTSIYRYLPVFTSVYQYLPLAWPILVLTTFLPTLPKMCIYDSMFSRKGTC